VNHAATAVAAAKNRWRKWTIASLALCTIGIATALVIFAADPAPGGWMNRFQRTATTDTFEVELNQPATTVAVSTFDGKPCAIVASGVQKFTMECPTQLGQKWSLSVTRRDGSIDSTVWNRGGFWVLPYLIGALIAAAVAGAATIVFASLAIFSARPPRKDL
jgi:hypothetical protein